MFFYVCVRLICISVAVFVLVCVCGGVYLSVNDEVTNRGPGIQTDGERQTDRQTDILAGSQIDSRAYRQSERDSSTFTCTA